MKFFMNRAQPLAVHMSINLCRRNIGVSQHLLDRTQIRAVLQQMSGKRMPKSMRFRQLFYICPSGVLFDELPDTLAADFLS